MSRINRVHPHKPEHAGAKHSYDRRCHRVTHSPKTAARYFVNARKKLQQANWPHSYHCVVYNVLVRWEDLYKKVSANKEYQTQPKTACKPDKGAKPVYLFTAFLILSRKILTCKGGRSLSESVYHKICHELKILFRCASSDTVWTEAVYRRLYHNVWQWENHALQTSRQAYLYDTKEIFPAYPELSEIKSQHLLLVGKKVKYHAGTEKVWYNSCRCNACHAHFEHDHEHKVQNNIYNACGDKSVKRSGAVALAPKHRRTKVIYLDKRHCKEEYPEIQRCKL